MKLPLNWLERQTEINSDTIKINYNVTYKNVVKAYDDEDYVKEAIINIASVIFTTVSDVNSVEIKFNDYRYSITKEILQETYSITNFEEVIEKEKWDKLITRKLISDEFVNNTFKLFKKSKVSKKS